MQLIAPLPFDEAVQKFGERSPVASILKSHDWQNVPVALRERAFFSATVENVRFLQLGQTTIMDALTGATAVNESGEKYFKSQGRAQFVERMQQFAIKSGMGPLDPKDKGTLKDIRSEGRLALIYDTNVKAAQDFGYYKQGQDPEVLDAFPAQRFIRVHLVKKPRTYHRAHEGEVHRKDDLEFWLDMNRDFRVPWGPWGYNSGMDVEDVGRREAESIGLVSPNEDLTRPAARNAGREFNERLQASTQGLSPKLVNFLKLAFNDGKQQVAFEDDAVKWIIPNHTTRTRGGKITDYLAEGRPSSDRVTSAPGLPRKISEADARDRLETNEPVMDRDGEEVRFGNKLAEHLDEEKRRQNRFPMLNMAQEAVRTPAEKWKDGDHVNYIKYYTTLNKTRAVAVSVEKGEVKTFYYMAKPKKMDAFRKGEKLIPKKENAGG